MGYRAWRLDEVLGRWRLKSLFKPITWPATEPVVARCLQDPPASHDSPAPGCKCGLTAILLTGKAPTLAEATALVGNAVRLSGEPVRAVYGVMAGWGQVEIGESGFRAQYASVAGLLGGYPPGSVSDSLLAYLSDLYDVPVLEPAGVVRR